jgi:hypothetical protein
VTMNIKRMVIARLNMAESPDLQASECDLHESCSSQSRLAGAWHTAGQRSATTDSHDPPADALTGW